MNTATSAASKLTEEAQNVILDAVDKLTTALANAGGSAVSTTAATQACSFLRYGLCRHG